MNFLSKIHGAPKFSTYTNISLPLLCIVLPIGASWMWLGYVNALFDYVINDVNLDLKAPNLRHFCRNLKILKMIFSGLPRPTTM
jgi:hypothetical protein